MDGDNVTPGQSPLLSFIELIRPRCFRFGLPAITPTLGVVGFVEACRSFAIFHRRCPFYTIFRLPDDWRSPSRIWRRDKFLRFAPPASLDQCRMPSVVELSRTISMVFSFPPNLLTRASRVLLLRRGPASVAVLSQPGKVFDSRSCHRHGPQRLR